MGLRYFFFSFPRCCSTEQRAKGVQSPREGEGEGERERDVRSLSSHDVVFSQVGGRHRSDFHLWDADLRQWSPTKDGLVRELRHLDQVHFSKVHGGVCVRTRVSSLSLPNSTLLLHACVVVWELPPPFFCHPPPATIPMIWRATNDCETEDRKKIQRRLKNIHAHTTLCSGGRLWGTGGSNSTMCSIHASFQGHLCVCVCVCVCHALRFRKHTQKAHSAKTLPMRFEGILNGPSHHNITTELCAAGDS